MPVHGPRSDVQMDFCNSKCSAARDTWMSTQCGATRASAGRIRSVCPRMTLQSESTYANAVGDHACAFGQGPRTKKVAKRRLGMWVGVKSKSGVNVAFFPAASLFTSRYFRFFSSQTCPAQKFLNGKFQQSEGYGHVGPTRREGPAPKPRISARGRDVVIKRRSGTHKAVSHGQA